MTLIKSISGFRGTIGGRPNDTLNPVEIAKSVSAYAALRERVVNRTFRRKIVVGRDAAFLAKWPATWFVARS